MNIKYDLPAEIGLDAYLLTRCRGENSPLPDGRLWERAVADLLWRPGLSRHQGPGFTTLFGMGSASGTPHEIDASASGWRGCLLIECKSRKNGVSKSDVAVFDQKTFDHYCASLATASEEHWWRLMVSSAPVTDNIRRLCIHNGIILCDPERLPLPVLLRTAGTPASDQYLPETELQEVIRLGEQFLSPMQMRWKLDSSGRLIHKPRISKGDDIDDLMWLQDELSGDLLDLFDLHRPERLERRTYELLQRVKMVSRG